MFIELGELSPDNKTYNSAKRQRNTWDLETAINVIPYGTGYKASDPLYRASINQTTTQIIGAKDAATASGNVLYVGDATTLYRLSSPGVSLSDVSAGGGYSTSSGDWWDFAQYGDVVIATNNAKSTLSGGTNPQFIDINSGAAFASIGLPFHAKYVAAVRDFVVYGYTWDATDGVVANRVRWTGFGDHTFGAISPANQSDMQDMLSRGGAITRILGGEDAFVIQENAVTRMSYEGPPTVFRFDEISPGLGSIAPMSCVRDGGSVYFYSTGGFARISQEGIQLVGLNKVDNVFRGKNTQLIKGAIDRKNKCIVWTLPNSSDSSISTYAACYFYAEDRWTEMSFLAGGGSYVNSSAESKLTFIFSYKGQDSDYSIGAQVKSHFSSAASLSDLTIVKKTSAETSLSTVWTPIINLVTKYSQIGEGRTMISRVKPIGSMTFFGAAQNYPTSGMYDYVINGTHFSFSGNSGAQTYTSLYDNYIARLNEFPFRANGRFHKLQIVGATGNIEGFDILEVSQAGSR